MSVFASPSRSLRRRVGVGIATVGIGTLLLAGCSASGGGTEESADPSAEACGPEAVETTAVEPAEITAAQDRDTSLTIGSILPTTGTLAFLGPPEIAGVDLAIADINASESGVLGGNAAVIHRDSGDTTTDIATQSASDLLSQGVSGIVGAASSGVSFTFIDQVTGAQVVQISPANTSPDFSDYDDGGYFWRTAPSDVLQGRVLGNLMVEDGATNIGLLYLNDAYGTGLAENVKTAVESAGGTIVAEEAFNEGDSQFSSQIDAIMAEDPDAIALIAFDQTKVIVPELVGTQGYPGEDVYFVDGNLADYSADFDEGTLNCAKGTLPGVLATDDFRSRLLGINPDLTDYSYAAESYDAVILMALAAIAADDASGPGIQSQMQAVSEGGTKCETFEECSALLADGEDIDYDGISGPITFDENGDPTEAYIGVYQYGEGNTYAPLDSQFGSLG
ncbi:amino acid/amide ABC transporter substrate-binding protein (HAAT family) [Labedella gwakjiensis]|uniref:Amino acid ABC transporter substrate-binding protein n=1 Tax=Labedella gwakjiensis TaxID=390269 RepID=A0A2P8GRV1_9MICO|nr:ABC transporter substrate-binding protein [Labedella gwakjiensis]PSL36696.1 amino acid/amide ABC transporter substrate-binding protein (HAAT family) [Labedella gwakjiensis]RUQ84215.1 amino acid ABC transporter substrate-binding protein [Labedella gwakjiensis]